MDSWHQLQKPGKLIGTIGSSLLHLWTWILTFMASLTPPESKSSWDCTSEPRNSAVDAKSQVRQSWQQSLSLTRWLDWPSGVILDPFADTNVWWPEAASRGIHAQVPVHFGHLPYLYTLWCCNWQSYHHHTLLVAGHWGNHVQGCEQWDQADISIQIRGHHLLWYTQLLPATTSTGHTQSTAPNFTFL